MTHEYVIAYNGSVEPRGDQPATAIGWANEAVLAVGGDDVVRAISRGDSTFIDLDGCIVTPLPTDIERATELVQATTDPDLDIGRMLLAEGVLEVSSLEPGSPADLAFWCPGSDLARLDGRAVLQLVARLREGHFTEGDPHLGPFPASPAQTFGRR